MNAILNEVLLFDALILTDSSVDSVLWLFILHTVRVSVLFEELLGLGEVALCIVEIVRSHLCVQVFVHSISCVGQGNGLVGFLTEESRVVFKGFIACIRNCSVLITTQFLNRVDALLTKILLFAGENVVHHLKATHW